MAMIERRVSAFGPQILKILNATRGQHGRENLSGRVSDQVTPGVSSGHLKSVRKPPGHIRRTTVISGIAVRQEGDDIRACRACLRSWKACLFPRGDGVGAFLNIG